MFEKMLFYQALKLIPLYCIKFLLQFKWPAIALILFKAFFAVYCLPWLIYNLVEAPGSEANNNQSPIVFLTTWSYVLLVIYLFASLIDVLYMTFK